MKCPLNNYAECVGRECPMYSVNDGCDLSGFAGNIGVIADMCSMVEDRLSEIQKILLYRLR